MNETIYALVEPESNAIRYIGMASDLRRRINNHRSECINGGKTYRAKWWRKCIDQYGKEPILRPLLRVGDLPWQAIERLFIATARHFDFRLTNTTSGGDGVRDLPPEVIQRSADKRRGLKRTPEQLERIRAAAAKREKISPEAIAKLIASNIGRPCTEEKKRKISAAQKGVPKSPQAIKAMADAHRGKPKSAQWLAKMRATAATPEYRAKQSANRLGTKHSPEMLTHLRKQAQSEEARKRAANGAKAAWQDPAFRQHQMNIRHSPEFKAKHAAAVAAGLAKRKSAILAQQAVHLSGDLFAEGDMGSMAADHGSERG